MKKSLSCVAVISLVSLAALAADPRAGGQRAGHRAVLPADHEAGAAPAERNKVEGTWQHPVEDDPGLVQIKVINQDHFIWVSYDKETRMPVNLAGGTYTLDGDTYKERVEFGRLGSPDLQRIVGTEQVFKVQIEGNTLTQIGRLSNGQELREVWKRAR
jgi:hypothetical protein